MEEVYWTNSRLQMDYSMTVITTGNLGLFFLQRVKLKRKSDH